MRAHTHIHTQTHFKKKHPVSSHGRNNTHTQTDHVIAIAKDHKVIKTHLKALILREDYQGEGENLCEYL